MEMIDRLARGVNRSRVLRPFRGGLRAWLFQFIEIFVTLNQSRRLFFLVKFILNFSVKAGNVHCHVFFSKRFSSLIAKKSVKKYKQSLSVDKSAQLLDLKEINLRFLVHY